MLAGILEDRITHLRAQVGECQARLVRVDPGRNLDRAHQQLDDLEARLHRCMRRRLDQQDERLNFCRVRLDGLNPTRVLARGYSVVQRLDGAVVTGPEEAPIGENLLVQATGGQYIVRRVDVGSGKGRE